MFNIAVIDDDKYFVQKICEYLEKSECYSYVEVYRFLEINQLIEKSQETHFNLLFVDIDLNDSINGIDMVNNYFKNTPVIYVTSYQDKMEDAFGKNTFKFVLKEKLDTFFKNQFAQVLNEILQVEIKIIESDGLCLLNVNDICYIKYENRDIHIYTNNDEHILKRKSLTSFIEPHKMFFIPISRDIYINWKYVKKVTKSCYVILKDEKCTELSIAKNRYNEFIEQYIAKESGLWY